MTISRPVTVATAAHGMKIIKLNPATFVNDHVKLARIFSNACPAVMFAKSRIPKLKPRAAYDTISIAIKNGPITSGIPAGIACDVSGIFLIANAIKLIPTNIENAAVNVAATEAVDVSKYGSNPAMFAAAIPTNVAPFGSVSKSMFAGPRPTVSKTSDTTSSAVMLLRPTIPSKNVSIKSVAINNVPIPQNKLSPNWSSGDAMNNPKPFTLFISNIPISQSFSESK
jgi:hypothetical protein